MLNIHDIRTGDVDADVVVDDDQELRLLQCLLVMHAMWQKKQ